MTNIGSFFKVLLKKPELYLPFLSSLVINGLVWFLIVWRLPASATWIPLHYSSYFGIDWIGPWIKITYYPALALGFIIFNLILAGLEYEKRNHLAYWLIWTALVVQIFILSSLIFLILNYFS